MEIEEQILGLGIIVGWLFAVLVSSLVGMIFEVNQFILIAMIGISAGVLFGLFLIAEIVWFFQRFKIVRRE